MGTMTLIGTGAGVGIESWIPAVQPVKGEGSWSSSPFLPGQQLILRTYDDAIETFNIIISGANKGEIDLREANMLLALENAVKFWTGNIAAQDPYTYIEYKADCGDFQYAIIKDYRYSVDDDLVAMGKGLSVAKHATLIVRRGAWQETPPGEFAFQNFGVDEYTGYEHSGGSYIVQKTGNTPDHNFKPIANFYTGQDYTEFYYYDDSAGAFSGNLLEQTPPYDVYVVPSQAADYLYFGVTQEGLAIFPAQNDRIIAPNSICFTIDDVLSSRPTSVVIINQLECLDAAGVWNVVAPTETIFISDAVGEADADPRQTWMLTWSRDDAPVGLRLLAPFGRTGFWYRIQPIANRRIYATQHPYSAQRNYIRFDQADTPGELDCLLRMMHFGTFYDPMKRILLSLRSQERFDDTDRGLTETNVDHFTGWITPTQGYIWGIDGGDSRTYNLDMYSLAVGGGVLADNTLPHGCYLDAGDYTGAPFTNTAIAYAYYYRAAMHGRFRAFMVIRQTNGTGGELSFRFGLLANVTDTDPLWTSKTVQSVTEGELEILEMGEMVLPPSLSSMEDPREGVGTSDKFFIYMDFAGSAANIQVDIIGIYLMPIDELAIEVYWPGAGPGPLPDGNVIQTSSNGFSFAIDSVTHQREPIWSTENDSVFGSAPDFPNKMPAIRYNLIPIASGKLHAPAGKTSRLYYFAMYWDDTWDAWLYAPNYILYAKALRTAQYMLTRT